jgi:hypothetical protein
MNRAGAVGRLPTALYLLRGHAGEDVIARSAALVNVLSSGHRDEFWQGVGKELAGSADHERHEVKNYTTLDGWFTSCSATYGGEASFQRGSSLSRLEGVERRDPERADDRLRV